ncbi:MAG: hypothetical protein ABWX62_03065 [Microterricola sp.]
MSGTPESGGDPACWLASVCPDCGRYVDERGVRRCPRCGAELPSTEAG